MAKVYEEQILIKISTLVKNIENNPIFFIDSNTESVKEGNVPADLFDRLSDVIEKAVTALLNEPVIVETTKLKTNIDLESEEE